MLAHYAPHTWPEVKDSTAMLITLGEDDGDTTVQDMLECAGGQLLQHVLVL